MMSRVLKISIAALLLVAASCGSDDSTTDEATDAVANATETGDEVLEDATADVDDAGSGEAAEAEAAVAAGAAGDLTISSITFDTSEVEIANNTDADIDLSTFHFCNRPDYAQIGDAPVVPAGGSVTVTSPVAIPLESGELGLYSEASFDNPDAIVAYVEWGEGEHGRSQVAVDAGIHDGTPAIVDGGILIGG